MDDGIVLREIDSGKEYLIKLPCVIGRSRDADLVLADQTVSRRHALVDRTSGKIWIQDLNSVNGTLINEQQIVDKTFIKKNDSIQIGQSHFVYPGLDEHAYEETRILHTLPPSTESPQDLTRLELIYAITIELPTTHEVKELGNKIFALFKNYYKHDRGYIAIFKENGSLLPLCSEPSSQSIPISRSIVKRVFANGESFVLADALANANYKDQESIIAKNIRSAMCAPLIYHNQIYGLIYLDRNIADAYSQQDLELFRSIAAIISPLIENARLWSSLNQKYKNTIKMLRHVQTRLIDAERIAAYSRVAHAMAHEIRNPLTTLGGLIRRIARSDQGAIDRKKYQAIMQAVERIELVLQEGDNLSRLSAPEIKLFRIDSIVNTVLETFQEEWRKKQISPDFLILTPQVMAPLDEKLLIKAITLILKEIITCLSPGNTLSIILRDGDNAAELCFGPLAENQRFADPFAQEFQHKPWRNNLFLNIAHKILMDNGGKLLLNVEGEKLLPLILSLPRAINI